MGDESRPRKINIALIIVCFVLIVFSAICHGGTNDEPFFSDLLLVIILKQPCAATAILTEIVHMETRSVRTEFVGAILCILVLCGMTACT